MCSRHVRIGDFAAVRGVDMWYYSVAKMLYQAGTRSIHGSNTKKSNRLALIQFSEHVNRRWRSSYGLCFPTNSLQPLLPRHLLFHFPINISSCSAADSLVHHNMPYASVLTLGGRNSSHQHGAKIVLSAQTGIFCVENHSTLATTYCQGSLARTDQS